MNDAILNIALILLHFYVISYTVYTYMTKNPRCVAIIIKWHGVHIKRRVF